MNSKPLKILLADDDKDDRFFFELALDSLTISTELMAVVDGEKLMEYLTENAHQLPDVLFLDLNMSRSMHYYQKSGMIHVLSTTIG